MRVGALAPALVLLCAAASAVLSAQSKQFEAERHRAHQEAEAARKARGLSLDDAMSKFPAPAIAQVKIQRVAAGGSVAVALAGRIPAGVTVLSDRDGAVLSGATASGTSFTARLTVGSNEIPGYVKLWAITPISFELTTVPVAFIDTVFRFDLKAADGMTVRVFPVEKAFVLSNEDRNAALKYQAEYYRPGEAKPFQTRTGTMTRYASSEPSATLDINFSEPSSSPKAELDEIMKKMNDPKLTDAQRNDLTMRMVNAQQRMMEDLMKQSKDPAAAQKQVDDFGCRQVLLSRGQNGAARGTIICGKNFNKGVVETTGTMTQVK